MDFRAFLVQELQARKERNQRYSLRAFARDLGISASRLTSVLKGTYGLSPEAATLIAPKLEVDLEQQALFISLVAKHHGRSRRERIQGEQQYQTFLQTKKGTEIGAAKKLIDDCIQKLKSPQDRTVDRGELESTLNLVSQYLDQITSN